MTCFLADNAVCMELGMLLLSLDDEEFIAPSLWLVFSGGSDTLSE